MNNRLKVILEDPILKIDLNDNIFSIGSCFSNELAKYLLKNGIYVLSNPFGTVYNVYSIYKIFDVILNKKEYSFKDLYHKENIYFTSEHSTKFDNINSEKCLDKINQNLSSTKEYFKNAKIYIITLGTSVVYLYKDKIVANCHKLPHDLFKKKILTVDENVKYLKSIINFIKNNNKNAKIIFTVSPVRHTPQNVVENTFSKSILRVSIENMVDNKSVFYFPAFEIVLDELRDYIYYKKDMVHLKDGTIDYILDKFISTYFKDNLKEYINKFNKIKNSLKHKTTNPLSEDNYKMLLDISKKIFELEKYKKNNLIDKQKKKLLIKIIDNFSKKKKEIEKLLEQFFSNDKECYNFFKIVLDEDYNKLIKIKPTEKILIKFREKVLLNNLLK